MTAMALSMTTRGGTLSAIDARPQDGDGHGTHVAGIIAAKDNGLGTTGVAPRAKIMPIRVLGRNGTDDRTLAAGYSLRGPKWR